MQRLHIDNKVIAVTAIHAAARDEDIPCFSVLAPYFQETLSFCRQWLSGVSSFTLHTSGSTGTPKAITVSRSQMEASAHMTIKALQLKASDTALVCLNTAYIAGKMMLVRGFEAGMNLYLVQPSSLPFAQVPASMAIRFTAMVPLQVQTTLASGDTAQIARFNSLKALLVGGAAVSYPLQQSISQQIKAPVYSTYGMTETVSHIALKRLNEPVQSEYTVLDGIHISTDDRGCLTIQGTVTNGQKLITNDVVQLKDAGHFTWIGRADHVINSGGIKVFPEKVESDIAPILHEAAITTRFFIAGIPDTYLGERVVLALESHPLQPQIEQKLRVSLRQQLRPYESPKDIYYIPAFVTTATGKIQRQQTLRKIHGQS